VLIVSWEARWRNGAGAAKDSCTKEVAGKEGYQGPSKDKGYWVGCVYEFSFVIQLNDSTTSPTKARALVAAGCTSIAELRNNSLFTEMLTPNQRIGLTYHGQIEQDVTRAQCEEALVSSDKYNTGRI
jgi:hypothetical protein